MLKVVKQPQACEDVADVEAIVEGIFRVVALFEHFEKHLGNCVRWCHEVIFVESFRVLFLQFFRDERLKLFRSACELPWCQLVVPKYLDWMWFLLMTTCLTFYLKCLIVLCFVCVASPTVADLRRIVVVVLVLLILMVLYTIEKVIGRLVWILTFK